MNIVDIETYLTITETRSLSSAAKMLFVTQSTISHRLSNLEKNLGIPLVIREKGKRNVELTIKGEQFISVAQRWVNLWKETQQLREIKSYMNLTIVQVDWFNFYPFTNLYKGIVQSEPLLKLDIKTGHSLPIYSMVNNHEADIGFVVRYVNSQSITCIPIFHDPLVMVCSSKALRPSRPLNPDELDVRNEIYWGFFGDYRHWHEQWWDSSIIPNMAVDFSSHSFEFLEDPKLWLMAPLYVAKQFCQRMDIQIHNLAYPPPDVVIYCIQRNIPRPKTTPAIEVFNDYLNLHILDIFPENTLLYKPRVRQ